LKKLSKDFLGHTIQEGQHNPIIDARAALALYRINERDWENTVKQKSYTDVRKKAEQDVSLLKTTTLGKHAAGT